MSTKSIGTTGRHSGMLEADGTAKQVDMSERPSALNATDAIRMIRQGELTPDALLESCIAQIEQVDPVVNAMITRAYDRAREQAQLATQTANRGDALGPLHARRERARRVLYDANDAADSTALLPQRCMDAVLRWIPGRRRMQARLC